MNLGQENAGVPQGLLISSQTDLPELLRQQDQIPMALVHFRPPFGDAGSRQAESLVTEPQKILQVSTNPSTRRQRQRLTKSPPGCSSGLNATTNSSGWP